MRTAIITILLALTAVLSAAANVSLTSASSGVVYRWNLSMFPNDAIPYLVNPVQSSGAIPISPSGTSPADLVSVVRSSFQMWQDIPTSSIRYTYQGITERTNALDGVNVVTFSPAAPIGAAGVAFVSAALGPGAVQIPGGPVINAAFAGQIIDVDIAINPQTNFSIAEGTLPSGQIPLEGTVMHEVGHFSGLDHTGVIGTVMYGFFNLGRGRINRAPREDDILGVSVLYPTPEFAANHGAISGRVLGVGGVPVFGAQVVALDASGRIVGATLTGVDSTGPHGGATSYSRTSGQYVLKGLPPGQYSIIAEPLDGPTVPLLGGVFGTGGTGASNIDTSFLPSTVLGPLTVTAGASASIDINVNAKGATAPNLGAAPSAGLTGQAFISPAEIETGTTATVAVGSNENLLNGNALIPNANFSVSGSGLTLGAASVNAGFIFLPVTAGAGAATAPRLFRVDTPQGASVMSGGVIVIPPALNFAQFANGAANSSTTVILNPSANAPAIGRLVFRDDQGNGARTGFVLSERDSASPADREPVQKTSFDFIAPPLGLATIQTDGLGTLLSGAATVRTTQPVGGITKFAIQGLGVAGVEQSKPVSGFVTPVRRKGTLDTGVAVANATTQQFDVTLTLRNSNGAIVTNPLTRTLAPSGHFAAFITQLFPNANLMDFDGTLTVTSGATTRLIIGTALELGANAGEFTALPVTELIEQPGEVVLRFAQFANGEGITSDIVITNASSTATLNGRVEFFDDAGNPLTTSITGVGTVNRLDFTITPLGSKTYNSDGLGGVVTGWARVTTDRASGGVVRFRLPGLGIAGVGRSDALEGGFMIPIKSNKAIGLDTGVALINPGDAAINGQMIIRNAAGTSLAVAPFSLPARGHLARMSRELFVMPDDFEGTLSVNVQTPGGRAAGTALEIGSTPGQFTTLPVVPLR